MVLCNDLGWLIQGLGHCLGVWTASCGLGISTFLLCQALEVDWHINDSSLLLSFSCQRISSQVDYAPTTVQNTCRLVVEESTALLYHFRAHEVGGNVQTLPEPDTGCGESARLRFAQEES
jgi:hypothetical protein